MILKKRLKNHFGVIYTIDIIEKKNYSVAGTCY